jgi:hypothetical protein
MFLKSSVPSNIFGRTARVILATVALVALSGQIFAQGVRLAQEDAVGSIVNVAQNKIMFKIKGVNVPMEIFKDVRVAVTGTAEVDFIPYIRAPFLLRFTSDMNAKNHQPMGKISEFEILSASEKTSPGMIRDDATPAGPETKKLPPPTTYILQVTGVPQSYKNGILQIGGKKFEVDPTAKISMKFDSLAGLAAIPPGKDVNIVLGYPENPQNKPKPPFYLLSLKYEFEETLSAPKKGGKKSESKLPISKTTAKGEEKKDDKKDDKPADKAGKDDGKAKAEAEKEKANEGKKK